MDKKQDTTTEEKRQPYDFIETDENGVSMGELSSYLNLSKIANDFKHRIEFIKKKRFTLTTDTKERVEIVESRVALLDKKTLMGLTDAQVDEIMNVNGTPLKIFLENPDMERDFRRDFVVYLKEAEEGILAAERELTKIEAERDKYSDKIKKLIEDYDSLNDYIVQRMRAALESGDVPEEDKNNIRPLLRAYECGFSLDPLYDTLMANVTKSGIDGTMYGYTHNLQKAINATHDLFAKAKVELPLHLYKDMESKCLPDKYKSFNNFILYILCRWVQCKRNSFTRNDGIFVMQVIYNIDAFMHNKFRQSTMQEFRRNLCRVIDVVIDKMSDETLRRRNNTRVIKK